MSRYSKSSIKCLSSPGLVPIDCKSNLFYNVNIPGVIANNMGIKLGMGLDNYAMILLFDQHYSHSIILDAVRISWTKSLDWTWWILKKEEDIPIKFLWSLGLYVNFKPSFYYLIFRIFQEFWADTNLGGVNNAANAKNFFRKLVWISLFLILLWQWVKIKEHSSDCFCLIVV